MAKTWKKVSQKTLLEHPRLSVYEDTVLLPNGHQTDYIYFGERQGANTIIAIDDKGMVLVQKEYSYPPNEWLYQFPGGAIEVGETPQQSADRELAEEAELKGTLTQIGWYYLDNRRRRDKLYVFLAKDLSASRRPKDIEEEFETYWFTEEEVDRLIKEEKIVNYSLLAAWAVYKAAK